MPLYLHLLAILVLDHLEFDLVVLPVATTRACHFRIRVLLDGESILCKGRGYGLQAEIEPGLFMHPHRQNSLRYRILYLTADDLSHGVLLDDSAIIVIDGV
jgi:hypothetical protein